MSTRSRSLARDPKPASLNGKSSSQSRTRPPPAPKKDSTNGKPSSQTRTRPAPLLKRDSANRSLPIIQIPLQEAPVVQKLDPYVVEVFDRVFSGHFHRIPKPLSKLVRVFTSSTFTDTTVERNALMEEVYPKLKEYCRETHGLDFQVMQIERNVTWFQYMPPSLRPLSIISSINHNEHVVLH